MVSQDTGGAIRGPLRGDVFWGNGSDAAARAGRMQSSAELYVLLPAAAVPAPTN
jgi:membrane-bound lytic murein transglycosylase A